MVGEEFEELEQRLKAVDRNLDRLSIPGWKYIAYGMGFAALCFLTMYLGMANLSKRKKLEVLKSGSPVGRTMPKTDYEALQARHSQLELNLAKARLETARAKETYSECDAKDARLEEYDAETARREEKLYEMMSEGWADDPNVPAAAD